jgi:hypothetical protein
MWLRPRTGALRAKTERGSVTRSGCARPKAGESGDADWKGKRAAVHRAALRDAGNSNGVEIIQPGVGVAVGQHLRRVRHQNEINPEGIESMQRR